MLVRLFADAEGAVVAKAPGLQKAGSKLAHTLKPADVLRIRLTGGRAATRVLTGVDVECSQPRWREELELLALYWFMTECAFVGSGSGALNAAVFALLKQLLARPPEAGEQYRVGTAFSLRLLRLHGLLPDLAHCAVDSHAIDADEPVFLLPNGEGVVGRSVYNRHYARTGGGLLRVGPARLARWLALSQSETPSLEQVDADATDAAVTVNLATQRISEEAGRPVGSAQFLAQQWRLPTLRQLLREHRD